MRCQDRSLVPEVTDDTVGALLFGTGTKNDALGGLKPKSSKAETEKGKSQHAGGGVGAMGGVMVLYRHFIRTAMVYTEAE